jgi:hypothetical protein
VLLFARVLLVITVLLLVVLVVALWRGGTTPRERDIAWLAGSGTVPDDEAEVVRRYLARHRRHRTAGGLVGVVATAVAAFRYQGSVSFSALLFGGIAGVLVGALVAESYRLGPRVGAAAVASLEPRDPAPLPRVVWMARGLLLVATLGATAISLQVRDTATLLLVAGGALVTGLAEATRARIVGRRRPVLSFRARELDARIRAFAGRSVANLQLAAALLVLTGVVASVPVPGGLPAALRGLVWLAGFVAAWVYTHRAAPRPPYSWRRPT